MVINQESFHCDNAFDFSVLVASPSGNHNPDISNGITILLLVVVSVGISFKYFLTRSLTVYSKR